MTHRDKISISEIIIMSITTFLVMLVSVAVGSVNIPIADTFSAIMSSIRGLGFDNDIAGAVVVSVRLPRVLATALVGAALALSGGVMQGLLRNPLADGSTLGVSAGASLGAVISIAVGFSVPSFSGGGTVLAAIIGAFVSLAVILIMSERLDYSLSTNTIILIGVVYSMFASAMINLVIAFSGDKMKPIVFWTMGSLASSKPFDVVLMLVALVVFSCIVLAHTNELNAFAIGEDNARHVGINVRRVKLLLLVAVSALIGVSVSISGNIGFVGLIIPHMTRMLTGPNHRRLLPFAMFFGAIFLMLADVVARTILKPLELPIGVVTSIIGCLVFVFIFYNSRKGKAV